MGLAFSGIGLAKDIYDGKNVKDALLDRLAHIFLYINYDKYKYNHSSSSEVKML